jgi:hypothetical protein
MMTKTAKMTWGRRFMFGATFLAASALAGAARADDGVEKAVSIAAAIGSERNDTVRPAGGGTAGQNAAMLGLTGIASVGPVAFGVTGELSSSVAGITNRTAGGLAGVRLPIGDHLRLLALGEAGMRMFSDADEIVFDATVTPRERSLPYVGGRAGVQWLALRHLDLGLMAFARTDIGEGTMTVQNPGFLGSETTSTTYQVGGFAGGLALQVGFRYDTKRVR